MRRAPAILALAIPLAWVLLPWAAPARAAEPALPTCKALLPALTADPSSARDGTPLLGLDAVVEDLQSGPDSRLCTGLARYRGRTSTLTYTAKWSDALRRSFDVNAHDTTTTEAESRARSLRVKSHPPGADGTFAFESEQRFCGDPDFITQAEAELHRGISFRGTFFREPDFRVFKASGNGYGTGILNNCVATVGTDTIKGDIFLGTNWTADSAQKYEFYILSPGPDGFNLKNRLWDIGSE